MRDTNELPQRHKTSNIFGFSAPNMMEFHVSPNYPDTNAKKMVCPKNAWIWLCSGTDWEEEIKDFLKVGNQKRGDKYPLRARLLQVVILPLSNEVVK